MNNKSTKSPSLLDMANYELGHFIFLPKEIIPLIIEASDPSVKNQLSRVCHLFWKLSLKFSNTIVYYSNENLPMPKLSDTFDAITLLTNEDYFTRVISITTYQLELHMDYAPLTYSLMVNGLKIFPQGCFSRITSLAVHFPDTYHKCEYEFSNCNANILNFLKIHQFENLEALVFSRLPPFKPLLEFCSESLMLRTLKILHCKLDPVTILDNFHHLQVLVMKLEYSGLMVNLPKDLKQFVIHIYGNRIDMHQSFNAESTKLEYFEAMFDSSNEKSVHVTLPGSLEIIVCNGTEEQITFHTNETSFPNVKEVYTHPDPGYPFYNDFEPNTKMFPNCINWGYLDPPTDYLEPEPPTDYLEPLTDNLEPPTDA